MNQESRRAESPDQVESAPDRLDGWKGIAAYLNRTVRTVQRWEKEEGLPVLRHQHQKLGSVSACKTELDEWMKRRRALPDYPAAITPPHAAEQSINETIEKAVEKAAGEIVSAVVPALSPQQLSPPAESRQFTRRAPASALLICLLMLTAAGYLTIESPPTAATSNREAYEAYFKGRYAWHKDTRAWFEQSAKFFEAAVESDPKFAAGWAGLATTYTTMALFGGCAPKDCFPRAQSAARRSLELNASLAERDCVIPLLDVHPLFDRFRNDSRFLELTARFGLLSQQQRG